MATGWPESSPRSSPRSIAPQDGGKAILERLTELALVEVLRRQLLGEPRGTTGWLAAIRDPILRRCLGLLHGDPAQPWTLQSLARQAGASRSVIAARFAARLGTTPIAYLRDQRLLLPRERLIDGNAPIVELALDAGYSSEAAFTRAFARATGCPPAAYRKQGRAVGVSKAG
ncbi:helix-turn-helix domain-containing protein [Paracoccus sphaerophysae]|uniref:helix-turn-helix domain-containing protein n=1 Tax=Paracoccus sphaerophysae TaxID=690417 RepID=UPI00068F28FF|nr:AraC family transcriptional regulator [Paracoccus sphaerophysae]